MPEPTARTSPVWSAVTRRNVNNDLVNRFDDVGPLAGVVALSAVAVDRFAS